MMKHGLQLVSLSPINNFKTVIHRKYAADVNVLVIFLKVLARFSCNLVVVPRIYFFRLTVVFATAMHES